MNSFQERDFQKAHFQTGGKANLGYMQLVSQGEVSLVHLWMPLEYHKILAKSGNKKLSRKINLFLLHANAEPSPVFSIPLHICSFENLRIVLKLESNFHSWTSLTWVLRILGSYCVHSLFFSCNLLCKWQIIYTDPKKIVPREKMTDKTESSPLQKRSQHRFEYFFCRMKRLFPAFQFPEILYKMLNDVQYK